MGESAALETENAEPSHSTKDDSVNSQQNDLDKAIKELSGVEAATTSRPSSSTDKPTKITDNANTDAKQADDTSTQIWDIPVDVNIIMGTAELTVARLMELENGDVVELNRRVGEPLDITVNGQKIAKGKIVKNENNESQFAIQLTELVGR